jgi:RNA polymerase sigma factor (sigma-70 family)
MSAILREFTSNQAALRRYLARWFSRAQDIEDMAQEAFLRAYAAEARQTILMPRAYLFRVAKHVALNELSRRRNSRSQPLEDFVDPDVVGFDTKPGLEQEVEGRRQLAVFAEAAAALPDQCRRVLLLKKIDGLSQRQIAEKLGIAESTVEKHLAKGLLLTREYMMKRDGYAGPAAAKDRTTPAAHRRRRGDGE